MNTLTDRYIWAVVRRLPHARRAAEGVQLRAEIDAAVAAKVGSGIKPDAAETAVITEFGDPDRRAAGTAGRPGYLIGPDWFFDYRRIMIVVLAAVAPSVFGALLLVQVLAGQDPWQSILGAVSVAFSACVQVGFWITAVFAVIERVSRRRHDHTDDWDVSELPEIPTARVGLGETIVAVLAYLLFIGLVFWQRNIWVVETAGGERLPVLDEALWDFWIPWFIALAMLEIGFALIAFAIGRWTWTLAWVNVALNLAFAVPAIWLITNDALLSDEFRATFREVAPIIDAVMRIIPFIVAIAAALDVLDGFRKAFRGSRARLT